MSLSSELISCLPIRVVLVVGEWLVAAEDDGVLGLGLGWEWGDWGGDDRVEDDGCGEGFCDWCSAGHCLIETGDIESVGPWLAIDSHIIVAIISHIPCLIVGPRNNLIVDLTNPRILNLRMSIPRQLISCLPTSIILVVN